MSSASIDSSLLIEAAKTTIRFYPDSHLGLDLKTLVNSLVNSETSLLGIPNSSFSLLRLLYKAQLEQSCHLQDVLLKNN